MVLMWYFRSVGCVIYEFCMMKFLFDTDEPNKSEQLRTIIRNKDMLIPKLTDNHELQFLLDMYANFKYILYHFVTYYRQELLFCFNFSMLVKNPANRSDAEKAYKVFLSYSILCFLFRD